MGNSSNPQQKLDIDVLAEFKELKKDSQGIMLQHNKNQQTYLLKEFTYASERIYEQERRRLEKEASQGGCENVLGVFKIKTHTIQGLCSTTYKLYAIYEYPQVNLQDQIIARKKQDKRFDQNQLWSILQSCNTALSNLKSTLSLNSHSIYITQDGLLKAIHNDMIDQNYRYTVDPRYYYAPQKIMNFSKMDSEAALGKQAVFSMGMTVLQAALLEETIDCYDYQKCLFMDVTLQGLIQSLEGFYSSDFIEIMTIILNVDPNNRPGWADLQKLLDNYWSNLEKSEEEAGGESLNVNEQGRNRNNGQRKSSKGLLISQEDKGVIRNLVTINSQQKESVRRQIISGKKSFYINKISQSIECSQQQFNAQMAEIQAKQNIVGSIKNERPSSKENLYTDPKLLEMIRKDLDDITKLKQSTLKETIKYSFLYPESDSIFKSIQDLKLPLRPISSNNLHSSPKRLKSSKQAEASPANNAVTNNFDHQKVCLKSSKKAEDSFKESQAKEVLSIQTIVDAEGHKYEGETLNGMKHGKGKLLFEDGAFYEGEFENDAINGHGVLYYRQNEPAYDGMWVDGQFHGQGILYNQCPQQLDQPFDFNDFDCMQEYWLRYIGEFDFDNKCGRGRLELTNGEVLEAVFESDMINGQGHFYGMNGSEVHGVWEMNRLVQVKEQ